ncbi:OLC1v1007951C1 [Oldenlandia corymbosa var. corymbosa]|nr:OLC1v1007951C1 [Oldenlandia corymbosa var. corymbosa]
MKTARLNDQQRTALLLAANHGKSQFVLKLVEMLSSQDLEMVDHRGFNVLHDVAICSSVEAAKAIVAKNPSLLLSKADGRFIPLFYAARQRLPSKSSEMLRYLYNVTSPILDLNRDETAPELLVALTNSGAYDIALKIIQEYPELALKPTTDGLTILYALASQPSALLRGNKIPSTWKSKIYPWMKIVTEEQRKHKDALKLVDFICDQLQKKSDEDILDYFMPSNSTSVLDIGIRNGAFDLVNTCIRNFPELIWYKFRSTDGDSENLFLLHVAVKHRQAEIFNYVLYLIGEDAGRPFSRASDIESNNILHLAANLAPILQLHSVPGPIFQMQRELQWFQAVEAIVYNDQMVARNKSYKTPLEIFYDKHDALMRDSKIWIKDTSNSCMVVAALVATVAFTSCITVPGGLKNDTGNPVFSKKAVFTVFSISNALSMISSATSLLLFLSLQMSRFTTHDFLKSLPKNLLRGLFALFVAVATMMIAFGMAIGITLQHKVSCFYIAIIGVVCIPLVTFTSLQLPLLFQVLDVTKRSERFRPY